MGKIKITKKMLKEQGSKVLATGETTDKILNFYGWGDPDKPLKFVVSKGFVSDWCVYLENMEIPQSFDQVLSVGNKLNPYTAKNLIDCSEEIWGRYRL